MMKITKLEKDTRVSWVCIDGVDEWKGTTILFKLSTHTKGSILFFSHNEWKSIERIFSNCNFDWARYLLSLKKYCEMGIGEPHLG